MTLLTILGGWGEAAPVEPSTDAVGAAFAEEVIIYGAQLEEIPLYGSELSEIITYGAQLEEQ